MNNAQALSHARTQGGLSQRKLARSVGVNYQVIRRLEAGGDDGNLTLRELDKICKVLGIPPTALLSEPELAPADRPVDQTEEIDLGQAHLLRRIQNGHDVRRTLTTDQQELVLPALLKLGLVVTTCGSALSLSRTTTADLLDPESHN